jgi:putative nucleotidyltransferase with HDIG domain
LTGLRLINRTLRCEALAPLFNGSIQKCEGELAQLETLSLEALSRALGEKDPYTEAHSYRVRVYAEVIADELGVKDDAPEEISRAAVLHDLGKLGVPEEILAKPEELTHEEAIVIRQHPQIAADVLGELLYPDECVAYVYHHHEWFNGEGYPAHSAGDGIPLGSRVIAVADAFDAMTSDRPYRKAISLKAAEVELTACAGSQFDPEVVAAFRRARRKGKLRIA